MTSAKKSFGQHFLQDERVVQKIIAAAEIVQGETVLEIGPGKDVLTEALVQAGARTVAVEADSDLIPFLTERFGNSVRIVHGDILHQDVRSLIAPATSYKLVSNLPYNITSAVLELFFTCAVRPSRFVIMIQKEVAERILAKPGEMSLLSVVCQLYADIRRVANVPPGAFAPPPKVDSTVICMGTKEAPAETEAVIALAKAGFASRRKQLHHNLSHAGYGEGAYIKVALQKLGKPATARPQELSPSEWTTLYRELR